MDEHLSPAPKKRAWLPWVFVAVLLVIAAGGGIFAFMKISSLSDDNDTLTTQIESVRRQLADAKASPTPSPSPAATPTPAPTPTSVKIKEFGVSFTVPPTLSDLTYTYDAAIKSVRFSSASLLKADATCTALGAPLGALSRVAKAAATPPSSAAVATVGAYKYAYSTPQSTCSGATTEGTALQQSQSAALQDALKSLK